MGYGRCTVCLKEFKQYERVKRFPRECDHIFHIKCLEVWMKIEASCPTCLRNYLGPDYTNKEITADELRMIEGNSSSDRNYAIDEIRDGCGDRIE